VLLARLRVVVHRATHAPEHPVARGSASYERFRSANFGSVAQSAVIARRLAPQPDGTAITILTTPLLLPKQMHKMSAFASTSSKLRTEMQYIYLNIFFVLRFYVDF
jgi:hypothetical protein